MAPFAAMARAGGSGFVLAHGVRRAAERYYRRELAAAAARYVPCVTGRGLPAGGFPGRVTDFLRIGLAPGAYDFYLCGAGEMIREAAWIVDDRFPGAYLFTEPFF